MENKPNLLILVGLPGSGKSTFTKTFLKENKDYLKVSRDDIRLSFKGEYVYDDTLESLVSSVQDKLISTILTANKSVILDNTHCRIAYIKDLINKYGKVANITIKVIGSELTLRQVKDQNLNRDKAVPEDVIDRMNPGYKYVKNNLAELNELINTLNKESEVVYTIPKRNVNLPKTIIVDIDGTVANMNDARGPYDWHKVNLDTPVEEVLSIVRSLSKNHKIVFLSGREDSCRKLTEEWLAQHYGLEYENLFMRKSLDFRKDSIIKNEIYMGFILPFYNVVGCLDDRDQVVQMWREELGLTCLQVAYGDF